MDHERRLVLAVVALILPLLLIASIACSRQDTAAIETVGPPPTPAPTAAAIPGTAFALQPGQSPSPVASPTPAPLPAALPQSRYQFRFECEDPVIGGAHETRGRGAAFLDIDGDGDLDVIHGSGMHAAMDLYNLGDGVFEQGHLEPPEGAPFPKGEVDKYGMETAPFERTFGIAVGDYDLDGDPDVYLGRGGTSGSFSNVLLENTGGGFLDVTERAGVGDPGTTWGTKFFDYDGDGYLDIYVANFGQPNVLYHNNGDGTFADVTEWAGVGEPMIARDAAWADYDNDKYPDLFVTGTSMGIGPARSKLYRNNGDGTFSDVTREAGIDPDHGGLSAAFADFNNDGLMDLFVSFWNSWRLWGTSQDQEISYLDMQTRHELQARHEFAEAGAYLPGAPNKVYINKGDGTFRLAKDTGLEYWAGTISLGTGDFDNDGFVDVYLGTGGPTFEDKDRLFRNNGDGTFTDVNQEAGIYEVAQGHGVVTGDYDRDGRLDFYVSAGGMMMRHATANVMCHNVGTVGNWLDVELASGKYAVQGAVITLVAGDTVQVRQVGAGAGFGSVNSPIVHFGLGELMRADRVTVRWSNGEVKVIEDIEANQTLAVTPNGPR